MFNSLRNQLLFALILVTALAISMSILVAVWSADQQFDELVIDIGAEEAFHLAGLAEVEYNLTSSMATVPMLLASQQVFYAETDEAFMHNDEGGEYRPFDAAQWEALLDEADPESEQEAVHTIMRYEWAQLAAEGERKGIVESSAEFDTLVDRWYWAQAFAYDQEWATEEALYFDSEESIIYLTDPNFHIIYSSDGSYLDTQLMDEFQAYSVPIDDWQSGDTVGYIFVESSPDFVSESIGFIEDTVYTSLRGGLLTAIFAIGIGLWQTQRISRPIRALTDAASRLAESGSTEQLPVNTTDELGRMTTAFNRMTKSLAAQQQIRQQLIADVSHELNTPLAIMRLEAQGMADGMQSPAEAATNIQREIDLLRNLVQDLELIAEADQNAITLHKEPVDVAQFLAEVVARWQPKGTTQGTALQLTITEPLASATFDPARMRQVLGNLLRNALQHTTGGQVAISAETTATHLNISIRDSGIGIGAEHLPFIFDRFYRTDESRQRVSGGRGLGLAIVQQLVQLHGGRVSATSELGVGSTFSVALPLQ